MSRLLQTIIILLVVVGLAICTFAILRACNDSSDSNTDSTTMNDFSDELDQEPDLEDLYEDELEDDIAIEEDEISREPEDESGEDAAAPASESNISDKYYVVVGSFVHEENAIDEVQNLKKKGYADAELVVFDFSQYHSVFAGRYNDLNDAFQLRDKLHADGFLETYVHQKRSKYQKQGLAEF